VLDPEAVGPVNGDLAGTAIMDLLTIDQHRVVGNVGLERELVGGLQLFAHFSQNTVCPRLDTRRIALPSHREDA
jgi:hypothetical protein